MNDHVEMKDAFQDYLSETMRLAAERFGTSLVATEYPNAGRDAPAHENNLTLHIAHQLLARDLRGQPWAVYAEPVLAPRKRIDLVAHCGEIALAVECKTFGNVSRKAANALDDWARLQAFRPCLATPRGNRSQIDWWASARERWVAIVICSFRDQPGGWTAVESAASTLIPAAWKMLCEVTSGAARGRFEICSDVQWHETNKGQLLYAASRQR